MKIGSARLETFTDGLVVIVITIMILEFKLPQINSRSTAHDVLVQLKSLLPYFISYIFSFTMIAILWTNHHHLFIFLEKIDENILWQNFLFLFLLSLIPFATYIVGSNPYIAISPAIYGGVMFLTTLSFVFMRHYSMRKSLTHKDPNPELTRQILKVSKRSKSKAVIAAIIYLVSIPVAFLNVYFAYVCFVLPPVLFFIPDGIDDENLADKVMEKNS